MNDNDTEGDRDRQYAKSQSIASQFNVIPDISPDDMLFDFLLQTAFSHNYTHTVQAYFSGGEDCARRFAALCDDHLQGKPQTVLEFASGYGRVARHARQFFPGTQWTSSDVQHKPSLSERMSSVSTPFFRRSGRLIGMPIARLKLSLLYLSFRICQTRRSDFGLSGCSAQLRTAESLFSLPTER